MYKLILLLFLTTPFSYSEETYTPNLYLNGTSLGVELSKWVAEQQFSNNALNSAIPYMYFSIRNLLNGKPYIFSNEDQEWVNLESWLETQDDGSVDPLSFLKKIIEINDGNIERSLILAWDYLSEDWQYALQRNFSIKGKKLKDITGEFLIFDGPLKFIPIQTKNGFKKDNRGNIILKQIHCHPV
jgi:hypothetical protein